MIHENDKIIIPLEYLSMSVEELRNEKEKVYAELRTHKYQYTRDTIAYSSQNRSKNIIYSV